MTKVLIEGFGNVLVDEYRNDGITTRDIVREALDELSDSGFDLSEIETIVTGLNKDVIIAIKRIVDETDDLTVDVDVYHSEVKRVSRNEKGTMSYEDIWKHPDFQDFVDPLITHVDDNDKVPIDLVVRVGDAGTSGDTMLRRGARCGIPSIDVNVDHLIDRDAAYAVDSENKEPTIS